MRRVKYGGHDRKTARMVGFNAALFHVWHARDPEDRIRKHLRAGIAEFRALLEQKYRDNCLPY